MRKNEHTIKKQAQNSLEKRESVRIFTE